VDKATVKEKARHELRNYAFVSGYLFVCFAVLWFYETTWSGDTEVMANLAAVAVKALVLGKFILLGEAVGVGNRSQAPHLLGSIVGKSLQFLVLLILLTVAEEVLVGWYHGVSFSQTLAEFEQHTVVQMLAKCLLALLILLPLIATKEFSRTLGPGKLRGLLLGSRADPG
jgi:hypothetical protein